MKRITIILAASAAQRTGTSDEIAEAAVFLLGEHPKSSPAPTC